MRTYKISDYETISFWFKKRGMSAPLRSDLPFIGLIEDSIAAGFLIKTDTNMGIIDFYVSNPDCSFMQSGRALDEITQGLLEIAAKEGMTRVLCTTQKNSIARLAIANGFNSQGQFESLVAEV